MPRRPYTIRKRIKLKPGEFKTIHIESFPEDYFVIEEIYVVWRPKVEVLFYFDGALWDVFKWYETLPEDDRYYIYSKSFKIPVIITESIRVDAFNKGSKAKEIEVIVDGHLAPKDEYEIKPA